MHAKTKIIIVLSFVSIILASIVISMVVTFASVNQTIESLVRVTYLSSSTQNVSASVSANKYFTKNEPIAFSGGTNGVITFNSESSSNQTLTTETTNLTGYYQYVIYEYVFTNNGENTMNVSLSANNLNNLKMFYTAPTTTRKTNIYTDFDENDYLEGTTTPAANIASGATAYVYVAIKIAVLANDASFNQNFVWTISDGAVS